MKMTGARDDVIDFPAAAVAARGLLSFRPGAPVQERIVELVTRDVAGELSAVEEMELELYLWVEQRFALAAVPPQRQLVLLEANAA